MEPTPKSPSPDTASRFGFATEKPPEAFGASNAGNGHNAANGATAADAMKQASVRFAELKEYASLLVAAKVDGLKLTLRNVVLYAVLGVIGLVIGAAVLVTAAVYVLSGLAGAIGALFPARVGWWAGQLIVGVLVIGGAVAGVLLLMKSLTGSSRKRTVEKYENRKRVERGLYGHDVAERARDQARRQ